METGTHGSVGEGRGVIPALDSNNGATFEIERKAFRAELEACHAITNQMSAKPKNEQFHSLGVFCFTTKAELVGDKMKHWCCRVVEHEKPTTENWKSYFVGYTHLKEQTWSALEPLQKMDVFSANPALAAGEDTAGLPDKVTPPDFVVEPQSASGYRLAEPLKSATPSANRHDESPADNSFDSPVLNF